MRATIFTAPTSDPSDRRFGSDKRVAMSEIGEYREWLGQKHLTSPVTWTRVGDHNTGNCDSLGQVGALVLASALSLNSLTDEGALDADVRSSVSEHTIAPEVDASPLNPLPTECRCRCTVLALQVMAAPCIMASLANALQRTICP
jgi:hypothetical protein